VRRALVVVLFVVCGALLMVGPLTGRRSTPGYDRTCSSGHACVFGPAWSDDVTVDLGHNGCDTRNDILRRDLEQVELQTGTRGCVVARGVLHDPYTGLTISYDKAGAVQVDHVVPLAAAWDLGASTWTSEQRRDFANDPDNLIATSAAANQAKGDKTPSQWLPAQGRCRYLQAYLDVATRYGVRIPPADWAAIWWARRSC
jgi:Protein of unknown function (DUF1524)